MNEYIQGTSWQAKQGQDEGSHTTKGCLNGTHSREENMVIRTCEPENSDKLYDSIHDLEFN